MSVKSLDPGREDAMKRAVAILAMAAGAVFLVQGVTAASPGIGQGPCHHGNSNASCKPDPQPSHGKDCQQHGGKGKHKGNSGTGNGGGNQDHCIVTPGTPNPSVTPTPTPTSTVLGVTLTKVAPKQLAKTGPKPTEPFVGVALLLFGTGLLLHTFNKKRAPQL
jgi:hypothetical protein